MLTLDVEHPRHGLSGTASWLPVQGSRRANQSLADLLLPPRTGRSSADGLGALQPVQFTDVVLPAKHYGSSRTPMFRRHLSFNPCHNPAMLCHPDSDPVTRGVTLLLIRAGAVCTTPGTGV